MTTGSLSTHAISHRHVAAEWQGARRRRDSNDGSQSQERGALRSSQRHLDATGMLATCAIRTRRRCWPMAKCSLSAVLTVSTALSRQRGTLRSGHRHLEGYRSLADARGSHTATLLPNGKVLVAGGSNVTTADLASAELYDPATALGRTGNLATARIAHTATLLPNGKVLVAGGQWPFWRSRECGTLRSGQRDLDRDGQPGQPRGISHGDIAAQRQGSGRRRGFNDEVLASAELYDPTSGTWSATRSLVTARELHSATLLENGKVLVAAGIGAGQDDPVLSSAELHNVDLGFRDAWRPEIATATFRFTSGHLPSGSPDRVSKASRKLRAATRRIHRLTTGRAIAQS